MSKYLMAFDQGTTSSRCILFDKGGNIKSDLKAGEINTIDVYKLIANEKNWNQLTATDYNKILSKTSV